MEGIIGEQKLMEGIIGEQKSCFYWQCIRPVFSPWNAGGGEIKRKDFILDCVQKFIHLT